MKFLTFSVESDLYRCGIWDDNIYKQTFFSSEFSIYEVAKSYNAIPLGHNNVAEIFNFRRRLVRLEKFYNDSLTCRVYRNFHRNCWSVQQHGIVVAHTNYLNLKDCKFVVRKGGRDRAIATGKKNVHAFIEGTITNDIPLHDIGRIKYNPYRLTKHNSFMCEGEPIYQAKAVSFQWYDVFKVE